MCRSRLCQLLFLLSAAAKAPLKHISDVVLLVSFLEKKMFNTSKATKINLHFLFYMLTCAHTRPSTPAVFLYRFNPWRIEKYLKKMHCIEHV